MRKCLSKFFSVVMVVFILFTIASVNTYAASRPVLKKGMSGAAVKTLQTDLKKLGFFSSSPTGYYGDLTVASVKKFQKKYNIPATGVVATLTYGKLDALLKPATKKTTTPAKSATSKPAINTSTKASNKPKEPDGLKMGDTSSQVLKLQNDLTSLGYMKVSPTGNFGSITENAVYQLQKYYKLAPSGIADDKTLSLIDRLLGRDDNVSRGGDADRGDVDRGGSDRGDLAAGGSDQGNLAAGGVNQSGLKPGGMDPVAVTPLYAVKKEWIPGLPQIPFLKGVGKYEGVVIHYTASPGDTARTEANHERKYWYKAFVHEFIDPNEIIQVADPDYKSWGVGESGNDRFINLELCDASNQRDFDISFDKITQRTAEYLFARRLGVTPAKSDGTGTLWGHFQVSKYLGDTNHSDPVAYLAKWGKSWDDVINTVTEKYNALALEQNPVDNSADEENTAGGNAADSTAGMATSGDSSASTTAGSGQ